MNNTFKLGRSIAQIIPFYRQIKEKELINNKLVITMAVVAIAKIAVLILWIRFNFRSTLVKNEARFNFIKYYMSI